MPDGELVWDADCRTAESPTYDDRANAIFFLDSGREQGRIFRYGIASDSRDFWDLPERVGSLGVCESGRLIVAMHRKMVFFDPETEKIQVLVDALDEPEGNRFNDGKVGPDGCFWVGTRDARREFPEGSPPPNGALYRVTPDGSLLQKAQGYATPNGIAWNANGDTMFHSDSFLQFIDAWRFDKATGEIADQRRIAHPTREEGRPDGGACDIDGHYYSAGTSGHTLNKFSSNGTMVSRTPTPCDGPTMPCFADNVLYLTSGGREQPADHERNPMLAGGLFRMPAPAIGVSVGRFADR